jgi:hypothetical protein
MATVLKRERDKVETFYECPACKGGAEKEEGSEEKDEDRRSSEATA